MAGYGRILFTACSASNYRSLPATRSCLNILPRYVSTMDKVMERLGFPPKPKRPITAYFRFLERCRKQLDVEEPNLNHLDKMKRLAQKWSVYDPKQKEALQKAYNLDMVAYAKQLMTYEQSITPEQKHALQEELNKEKLRREKLDLKKKCDELGKPKKPPTGFLQYLQENKYSKTQDEKRIDWIKTRAQRWREMSDDEKSKYKMESQRLMEQYKQDLRTWEENMVRNGHIDVVRNRGLLDIKYGTPNAE